MVNNVKNKMLLENALRELSGIQGLSIQGEVKSEAESGSPSDDKPPQPRDTVSTLLNAFGGQVV